MKDVLEFAGVMTAGLIIALILDALFEKFEPEESDYYDILESEIQIIVLKRKDNYSSVVYLMSIPGYGRANLYYTHEKAIYQEGDVIKAKVMKDKRTDSNVVNLDGIYEDILGEETLETKIS